MLLSRRWRRLRALPLLGLLLLLFFVLMPLLVSCRGINAQEIKGHKVQALDNIFEPAVLRIKPGETVTWINDGQTIHSVTADDKSFDSSDFASGELYTRSFKEPGRYPYYCYLHGAPGVGMVGEIIVEDTGAGQSSSSAAKGSYSYNHSELSPPGLVAQKAPVATLRVPEEYATITDAVKAAKPGSLVSIGPGVYKEAVIVQTPDLTIRGRDRNAVILEGNFELANAFHVTANNVVLENMTARHYKANGFYWSGVTGYRGSYLTAYSNGDYGIYAFSSVTGQFDHSFAAGHPDSGFYIGACNPCNAIITDVISEENALGYSGTNAGGNLIIKDSIWRNNLAGIVPNTLDSEPKAPQDGVTIMNNLVENNSNLQVPTERSTYPSQGNGIVIAGGINNVVTNNRVNGHHYYGIVVVPNIDKNFWFPSGNSIKNNTVTNSGVADLALAGLSAGNNCFSDNQVARTSPPFLQLSHSCGSLSAVAAGGDPSVTLVFLNHFLQVLQGRYQTSDWKTYAIAAKLEYPGMPNPDADLQGIQTTIEGTKLDMTPAATTVTAGLTLAGLGLNNPFFQVLLDFYAYLLPLSLYAAWLGIATWDIIRRSQSKEGAYLSEGARIGWLALVYLVPLLGPLAYYFFGRSGISRTIRLSLVVGLPIAHLLISVALMLLIS